MASRKQRWAHSPGHVVYARIQYADVEGSKSRFAVVVSSHEFNTRYTELIVAFATRSRNIRHPLGYDVEIPDSHPRFNLTGLSESTTVRCGRLWTLDSHAIINNAGVVPDDVLADIQRLTLECFEVR